MFHVIGSIAYIHIAPLLWEVQYQAVLEEVSLHPRCWMLARDLSKAHKQVQRIPIPQVTHCLHEWLDPWPHDDLGPWFSSRLHSPAVTHPLSTEGVAMRLLLLLVTWEESPLSSSEWVLTWPPQQYSLAVIPSPPLEEAQLLLITVTWQRWDTRGQGIWVCFPPPHLTIVRTSVGEWCQFTFCCWCFFFVVVCFHLKPSLAIHLMLHCPHNYLYWLYITSSHNRIYLSSSWFSSSNFVL